jgi:hypothetical protein
MKNPFIGKADEGVLLVSGMTIRVFGTFPQNA